MGKKNFFFSFFFCPFLFLIQQHSCGRTNSTFRKRKWISCAEHFTSCEGEQFIIEHFTAFSYGLENPKAEYLESANLKHNIFTTNHCNNSNHPYYLMHALKKTNKKSSFLFLTNHIFKTSSENDLFSDIQVLVLTLHYALQ